MSARPRCSSNTSTTRPAQIRSLPSELISRKKRYRLTAKSSLSRSGIPPVRRNSSHLDSLSIEVPTVALSVSILLMRQVSTPLTNGRRASSRTPVLTIQKLSHSSSLETKSIGSLRGRYLPPKLKHGAKRITICSILKPRLKRDKE